MHEQPRWETDTTVTPDSAPYPVSSTLPPFGHRVLVGVQWVLKERQGGLYVPVRSFHNLLTTYGLTAYAMAPGGAYLAPTYLVIDTAKTAMSAQGNVGATTIQVYADPTVAGDSQLVLSVGLAAQEVVTFTAKSGSGPYTFTLSGSLVNVHAINDPVVRAVTASDTMASVLGEGQYDPASNPNGRMFSAGTFSPAAGQGTMQFFFSGQTATNMFFAHVGLADQQIIGNPATNLHNYASLGYNHTNTNDLEVDVTYTLTAI